MSSVKQGAAPGKHHVDGPPRLSSSRCVNHNNSASAFNQSSSGVNPTLTKKPEGDKMNKSVALTTQNQAHASVNHFTNQQLEILKNSICKGSTNEEFEIFIMACRKTQLDPFMRQIYAVKRKSKKADGSWGETMTIQTGIDGYRLIAERTERYAPGAEPTYTYDKDGKLTSATAYIKKQTKDGTWHIVSASAHLDEYMQTFTDKNTGEKKPTGMWVNMQRTMLAKCAEAQALRRAFPAEMSGVYTKEEMQQADIEDITPKMPIEQNFLEDKPKITANQIKEIEMILDECDEKYRNWVYEYVSKTFKTNDLSGVPSDAYDKMKLASIKNMEKNHAQQKADDEQVTLAEVQ